jgi:carbon-monoxide dehydrogenase small subunit
VKSCITLTVDVVDRDIQTIEGRTRSPVQKAFQEENGFQCGFCTPGFVMNAEALVREHPNANDEIRRTWLESNICRCTGYENIEKAVNRAASRESEQEK